MGSARQTAANRSQDNSVATPSTMYSSLKMIPSKWLARDLSNKSIDRATSFFPGLKHTVTLSLLRLWLIKLGPIKGTRVCLPPGVIQLFLNVFQSIYIRPLVWFYLFLLYVFFRMRKCSVAVDRSVRRMGKAGRGGGGWKLVEQTGRVEQLFRSQRGL